MWVAYPLDYDYVVTRRKMMDSELEELQLQVEGGICKLPNVEMEKLTEHVGLESKE